MATETSSTPTRVQTEGAPLGRIALRPAGCTCTVTAFERQENPRCPVHFPSAAPNDTLREFRHDATGITLLAPSSAPASSPTVAVDLGELTEAMRESEPPAPSSRFPKASLVLDAQMMALAMRATAQTLDLLAGAASKYSPEDLRKHVHGVARMLVVQIRRRGVAL